jgi:succinate-semialdehyde dehydrogenase/glutarate-semialdehyde dehydrogenase
VVLELGGSDPFIVLPSADLDAAVATAVKGRLQNNAGQSCISSKRFIVHEQVAQAFEERLVQAFAKLKVGDPADPATEVGPLSGEQTLHDVTRQVEEAVSQGATKACGGQRVGLRGFFYAPTVLLGARQTVAFQEETFGPVAAVARVKNLDEAIALANDTPFGLASCAFTNDAAETERLCDELQAGSVFINGLVKSDPRLPFGGIKASGFGRELARDGIVEFTNAKTIWLG